MAESTVAAKFKRAFIAPIRPPRVTNDPVLVALTVNFLVTMVHFAETNNHDTMINFIRLIRAVQVFFGDDATIIAL